ncbi:hypothetical protein [Oceanirhabdus sp. W0125-5]|uniref:hypothetical protein n=1 Tax=Oceanirhabdus sp. W0125-5 TaxID=2999116 RepID=UPI0022F2CC99|nr:hypothetical protein [Oceanirhabdus sp. W0125-5]WBW96484.1 hypothetical protein OW730_22730 [Oceanirhabdus sp. W0125-5]
MKVWVRTAIMMISLMLICSNVFADIPNGSVVIGNKGYDIKYVNRTENKEEIQEAIKSIGKDMKIYVKSYKGIWYDNDGEKVDKSLIPKVDYISEEGKVIKYQSGDRDELSQKFKVENVAFLDTEHIEIIFTEPVLDKEYTESIKLSGDYFVKNTKVEDGKIIATLEDEIKSEIYEGTITISEDVMSVYKNTLGREIKYDIYVINKSKLSNCSFDKNVCITSNGFKGNNLTFNGRLTVCGDYGILKDCKIDDVLIKPGKFGSISLIGVEVDKMSVLSGGKYGVKIKECEINKLLINSITDTGIINLGGSKVKSTIIHSDAILDTEKDIFEDIKIVSSKDQNIVKLRGKFNNIITEDNIFIKAYYNAEINAIVVKGNVRLEGPFSTVDIQDEDSIIEIRDGTEIKKLTVNEKNLVIISGKTRIVHLEGPHDKIIEINKAIEDANRKAENLNNE